jgi:hypothetical protein
MSYFGPLLNQRLVDLHEDQKQDKYLAGCDPWCPWWEAAEEREEAIQAKLEEQDIEEPARAQMGYFSPDRPFAFWRKVSLRLAHGIPDAERVYLTMADRKAIILEGFGYLRRHPEMVEDALSPEDQAKDDEWERYVAAGL